MRNRRQHRRVVQVLFGLDVSLTLGALSLVVAPILILERELVGLGFVEGQVLAQRLHLDLLGCARGKHHVLAPGREHVMFRGRSRGGRRSFIELDFIQLGAHSVRGFLAAYVGKDLGDVRICLSIEELLDVDFSHERSLLLDFGYEALADLPDFSLDLDKRLCRLVLLEVQHLAHRKNALFQGHVVVGVGG